LKKNKIAKENSDEGPGLESEIALSCPFDLIFYMSIVLLMKRVADVR